MTAKKWTAAKLPAWEVRHAEALAAKQTERAARIADQVSQALQSMMKRGMTKNDAGDCIAHRWLNLGREFGTCTAAETRRALEALGWEPKRGRGKAAVTE